MISQTNADFWACFNALPEEIRRQAHEKFKLWRHDAFNATLLFKLLIGRVWSVRINQNYRAAGRRYGSVIVWFWIGTHADYDQLLKKI